MTALHAMLGCLLLGVSLCSMGCAHQAAGPETAADLGNGKDQATARRELLELGLEFAQAGDAIRGEQYLSAALEAGADPNQALLPLIELCVRAGRLEAAAQYGEVYRRPIQAKRELSMLLGGIYISLDQDEKAVVELQRVNKDYPKYPLSHLLLARLLRQRQRDLEQADQQFRAYLELAPEGPYANEARESLLTQVSETEQLPSVPGPEAP